MRCVNLFKAGAVLKRHLDQFVSDLELEPLKPKDEQGFFSLELMPGMVIKFKELDPGCFFICPIIACTDKHRESLFIHLMKANFLGLATGGAVIGLDVEEKFLTLSRTMPYDINYKTFKEAVEDFANYLDFWHEEVKRHQKTAAEGIL